MKIQEAFAKNKEYWQAQIKLLEGRLSVHKAEVQKIASELDEAKNQVSLYNEAQNFILKSFVGVQAEAVDSMKAEIPIDAIAVEEKK